MTNAIANAAKDLGGFLFQETHSPAPEDTPVINGRDYNVPDTDALSL